MRKECILDRMDAHLDWKESCKFRSRLEATYRKQLTVFHTYTRRLNICNPTKLPPSKLDSTFETLSHIKDVWKVQAKFEEQETKHKLPRWLRIGTYFSSSSIHKGGQFTEEHCKVLWYLYGPSGTLVEFEFCYSDEYLAKQRYVKYRIEGEWKILFQQHKKSDKEYVATILVELQKGLGEAVCGNHLVLYVGTCISLRKHYSPEGLWPETCSTLRETL